MTWRGEVEPTAGGHIRLAMSDGMGVQYTLFEPEAAEEAARALNEWLTNGDHDHIERWDLAVKRAADELVECLKPWRVSPFPAEAALMADKILSRAAPRGVFAVAQQILTDPHRYNHLMKIDEHGWTVQHPVQERLDGALFDCWFGSQHAAVQLDLMYDHRQPGLYRIWRTSDDTVGEESVG